MNKNFTLTFSQKTSLFVLAVLMTLVCVFFFGGSEIQTLSAQENTFSENKSDMQIARPNMLAVALDFRSGADRTTFAGKGIFSDENSSVGGYFVDALKDEKTGENVRADLEKSFSVINQLPCQKMNTEILRGGKFSPGVYCVSAADLSEETVFDGEENANGFFVFLVKDSLSANSGLKMSLTGKARSENIFFVVGDTAKIGSQTHLSGNIFARNSVEAESGSKIQGKVFSLDGSIKLNEAEISPNNSGFISICKQQVGTGLEDRIFRFRLGSNTILVQTGRCSPPIELAQGNYVIEELLDGYLTTGGIFNGRFRTVDINSPTQGAVVSTSLLQRTANIFVRDGTFEQPTTFNFVNTFSQIGIIEICKEAVAETTNPPINDQDVTGFFDYTVDAIPNQIFTVAAGQCSGAIQVNVPTLPPMPFPQNGQVRVTEIARSGYTLDSGRTFPADRLFGVTFNKGINNSDNVTEFDNPRGGYATARFLEGDTSNRTIFYFKNRSNPARVKICKIAGTGIPVGTRFNFTVTGLIQNATTAPVVIPSTTTTETVTVQAGLVSQGGLCAFTNNRYIVGSNVTIVEQLPALEPIPNAPPGEVRVSRIQVSGSSAGVTSNLNTRTVTFPVRREEVEVKYTNIVFRPTLLKICKIAGNSIVIGTPFTFDVVIVDNPEIVVPPVTVQAGPASQGGFCVFAQGPYPATANTTPSVGTFAVGSTISVRERSTPGIWLSLIISQTGDLTVSLADRVGTLTLQHPNNFNEVTFINSIECPVICYFSDIPFDFDGDLRAEISTFSQDGKWSWIRSSSGIREQYAFGFGTDLPVTADYDGEGKNDIAVFRNGNWYIWQSSNGQFRAEQFGMTGDVPQPGDYDGDGRADIAVFRPSNGTWYIARSRDGFTSFQFGLPTDKSVPGDYDGDGRTDIAVYRPSNGTWYQMRSRDGFFAFHFGISTDKLVPADYDGDGKTDIAVYRNGFWYIMRSLSGFRAEQFGIATDIPVPADYDGDRKADIAVYRAGTWHLLLSGSSPSQNYESIHFGTATDTPFPSIYVR